MVERCVRDGRGKKKTRVSFSPPVYRRHPLVASGRRRQKPGVKEAVARTFATKIEYVLIEVWLSLVERCVRDAEVASSNLVTSTKHE